MKKLISILFLLSFVLCAHAEIIVLRTGARVKGTVVFQNEEVFIFRDASGARFQYPREEVAGVLPDDEEEQPAAEEEEQEIRTSKKVSIVLELAGGAAFCPKDTVGGAFSVDLLVGSHHIGEKHIMVGAGLGYHGYFLQDKYNFLPIEFALRMPFTEQKHAPVFGLSLGYGIALSKNYLGGLYAGLDFGYRCQVNPKTAIALMLFGQFQQAKVTVTETIEGVDFQNKTGRSLVTTGLKFALFF